MKFFTLSLLLPSLLANLTACGTLLHPERTGQTGGHIDPGVVVLDGIGLLFFFIPGIMAFAVNQAVSAADEINNAIDSLRSLMVQFRPKTA
jgi:hypothetical protein